MADNSSLHKANKAKKDEFYTQLEDIENELKHYKKEFKDKVIFCNCDDPYESNFFKYFAMNFNAFGLKKLIATSYASSPVICQQLALFDVQTIEYKIEDGKKPYKIEITEVSDKNGDGAVDLADVEWLIKNGKNTLTLLEGDGDFRSQECIELLKEADIVITNPPFSLFREYVAQLVEYDKKFIIIGNKNAITYKEIFPLIKENKIWLGYGFSGGNAYFAVPTEENHRFASGVYDNKTGLVKFRNCTWFTNIDHQKRHEDLTLYKYYTPEEYPKYDNYDAINVDKVADIPVDYYECMGVPITFLDKYNPEQFELVNANDIRKDRVKIRPKPHGLIKDKEATITESVCSQTIKVERERERESSHDLCSNRHQKKTIDNHMSSQVDTLVSMEYESMQGFSSYEKGKKILIEEYGFKENEITYCNGLMGVPITFLDKFNPEQFEIIWTTDRGGDGQIEHYKKKHDRYDAPVINGKGIYKRILIKRKDSSI